MNWLRTVLADAPDVIFLNDLASGTIVLDRSGNGNTGTASAGLTPGGDSFLGRPAPLWDSQTLDRIAFGRLAGAFGQGQAFSVGAWIKTTNADGTSTYAGNPALTVVGDHSANIWNGFGVHGGTIRYSLFNNGGSVWQYANGTAVVNDGGWHYIGFSCTGAAGAGNVLLYADGVLDGTASLTISVHGSANVGFDTIGAGYIDGTAYTDGFLGSIGPVFVKKGVVAAARFKAHYEAGIRQGVVNG